MKEKDSIKQNNTVINFRKRETSASKEKKYVFILGKGKVRNKLTPIFTLPKGNSLSSLPNVDKPPTYVETKVAKDNQKAANDSIKSNEQAASVKEEPSLDKPKSVYSHYKQTGEILGGFKKSFLRPGDKPCSELDNNPTSESFRLRSWLYSYTGIGMDYSRPVSDANPARFCVLDISDAEKRERLKRARHAACSRQKNKGSLYEDHRGQHWRGTLRFDVDHLFMKTLFKGQQARLNRIEKEKYQSLKDKEPQNRLFARSSVYLSIKDGQNSKFFDSEQKRLSEWHYRHDYLNRWVDIGPALYHSFTAKGFYGGRNEGERAAEFASNYRFAKTSASVMSIKENQDKWNRYMCYYAMAEMGKISYENLIIHSKNIWGESNEDVLIFDKIPEKASALESHGTADDYSEVEDPHSLISQEVEYSYEQPSIVIPALAWSNQEAERVYRDTISSQHASGHSNEEVYSLVVKQAWKNIPNMLVLVPESFNTTTYSVDLTTSVNNAFDKQAHLKLG